MAMKGDEPWGMTLGATLALITKPKLYLRRSPDAWLVTEDLYDETLSTLYLRSAFRVYPEGDVLNCIDRREWK